MQREERRKLYLEQVCNAIPRILSELDRDSLSFTYGSFDREYWAWATKDFSNIDLQRAAYPLTLLYLNAAPGNPWFKSPRIKDWIIASIKFWCKSQRKDGSFDHHYPHEHSFVGAAFTLYELSQVFMEFKNSGELDDDLEPVWLAAMKKAADFLCRHDELHGFISNHRAGAACALFSIFLITQESRYKERAYFFIESIKKMMSEKEGWLCEYGGADPGYQTLDTYYLANFYRLSGDKKVLEEVTAPSLKFLIYFFHPDGSVGGEYGSRNCPLYYPAGFEILGDLIPEAEAIAQTGVEAIMKRNSPALADHDIRNFVPMLSAYAQAAMCAKGPSSSSAPKMPFTREFEKYWPQAGLFISSGKKFYSVVGCSKGGVVKVYDKIRKTLSGAHAGYLIEFKNRHLCSNQYLSGDNIVEPVSRENKLSLAVDFFLVMRIRTMAPLRFLFFRLFNLTLGRSKALNNWFRYNIITNIFIQRRVKFPLKASREITFGDSAVRIKDKFDGLKFDDIKSIRASDIFTTIYMASSKYYRNSEMIVDALSKDDLLDHLKKDPDASIGYSIDASGIKLE